MSAGLTAKQSAVLDFIRERVEVDGYPPTVREIGGHFGHANLNGLACHLGALEKKGFIERGKFDSGRSIRVVGCVDLDEMLPPRTSAVGDLPPRQRGVYEFLRERFASSGVPPSVAEIGDHFGIVSPNGVLDHLRALEKKGLIRRRAGLSRAITILG